MEFHLSAPDTQQSPGHFVLLSRAASEPCSPAAYRAEDHSPPFKARCIRPKPAVLAGTDSSVTAPVAAQYPPVIPLQITPPDMLPSLTDVVNADGHTWLKYGEKRISKNTVMRSYYKCSWSRALQPCRATKTVDTDPRRPQRAVVRVHGSHNHAPGAACPRSACPRSAARRVPPPLDIPPASPSALRAKFSANAATRNPATAAENWPVSPQFANSQPVTPSMPSPMSGDSPSGPFGVSLSFHSTSSPGASPLASPLSDMAAPTTACDRPGRARVSDVALTGRGEGGGAEGRRVADMMAVDSETLGGAAVPGRAAAGGAAAYPGGAAAYPGGAAAYRGGAAACCFVDASAGVVSTSDGRLAAERPVTLSSLVSELQATRMGGPACSAAGQHGRREKAGGMRGTTGVARARAGEAVFMPPSFGWRGAGGAACPAVGDPARHKTEFKEEEQEHEGPSLDLSLGTPGSQHGREVPCPGTWGTELAALERAGQDASLQAMTVDAAAAAAGNAHALQPAFTQEPAPAGTQMYPALGAAPGRGTNSVDFTVAAQGAGLGVGMGGLAPQHQLWLPQRHQPQPQQPRPQQLRQQPRHVGIEADEPDAATCVLLAAALLQAAVNKRQHHV
ncbi:hypothetical protein CLOM_g7530 [Closterium sp. NIES-68]|nr:hypothetical protein CLOM_g7530 [Closterium sp. NIES-68]GJP80361.1 hypothetical protein CLOP_g10570 [Closterium sp. NIES-67]